MSRRSDLLSGLLLAATGFMQGRLIRNQRIAQAKQVDQEFKAKQEQAAFERDVARQRLDLQNRQFGLDQQEFGLKQTDVTEDNKRQQAAQLLDESKFKLDQELEPRRVSAQETSARASATSAGASMLKAKTDKETAYYQNPAFKAQVEALQPPGAGGSDYRMRDIPPQILDEARTRATASEERMRSIFKNKKDPRWSIANDYFKDPIANKMKVIDEWTARLRGPAGTQPQQPEVPTYQAPSDSIWRAIDSKWKGQY